MGQQIPDKEIKLLFLKSGGVCAFRGCGRKLIEPGTAQDDEAILGEMAHIVGSSRQGPRGDVPLSEEERNKHTNLILICRDHHRIIDTQPRTYSVAVIRQMKTDHEARVDKALATPTIAPKPELRQERIHSTLLPMTHLPQAVFAAPCGFSEREEEKVKQRIQYPDRKDGSAIELIPFLLRDKKLFAFHDLRQEGNPFSCVIDGANVEMVRSTQMWRDAEGKRRYVTLLNRSLYKYTARLGVRYDPDHRRFYFPVQEKGKKRVVRYRPLNARYSTKNVVWEPKDRKTGEGKGFWWHMAARLRFYQMSDSQWCLSVRPERHLTKDSETPFPSHRIGRRVTSLKSHMYNDLYLKEVVFWRDYLSRGQPRFILNFRNQSAIVDVQLVIFDVKWIGIPGDETPFKNQAYEEDLFTLSERQQALAGESIDWDEAEDESEEKEEEIYSDEY